MIDCNSISSLSEPKFLTVICSDEVPIKLPLDCALYIEQIGLMLSSRMQEGSQNICPTVHCREFSSKIFKAVISVATGEKTWSEVLDTVLVEKEGLSDEALEKELQNKNYLFNELYRCNDYLYPSQTPEKKLQLLTSLFYMPLQNAKNILKDYESLPMTFLLAYKRLKHSIYFATEKDANEHFAAQNKCQEQIFQLEKGLEIVYKKRSLLLEASEKLTKSELVTEDRERVGEPQKKIDELKQALQSMRCEWKRLQEVFNTKKLSIKQHVYASRHISHPDLLIQAKAIRSREILAEHTESMRNVLENTWADLSRQDLLDHLIGPKAYLLAHYNIVLGKIKSKNHPFVYNDSSLKNNSFGYELNNLGPWYLEEEIRKDLERLSVNLPPRLIQDQVITKIASPKEKEMQQKWWPILQNWNTSSYEECLEFYKTLVTFNGWNKYGIKGEDMQLSIDKNFVENGCICGQLKGKEVDIKTPFCFQVFDFLLQIENYGILGTHDFLRNRLLPSYRITGSQALF